jgi:hypothetical protein
MFGGSKFHSPHDSDDNQPRNNEFWQSRNSCHCCAHRQGRPRRCGIASFVFNGRAAHFVPGNLATAEQNLSNRVLLNREGRIAVGWHSTNRTDDLAQDCRKRLTSSSVKTCH